MADELEAILSDIGKENVSEHAAIEPKSSSSKPSKTFSTLVSTIEKKDLVPPFIEPNTKLKISTPVITKQEYGELTNEKQFRSLASVTPLQEKSMSEWFTIGVVSSKSVKISSKDNKYCLWNLTDLVNESSISLFLFIKIDARVASVLEGSIIGLLGPKVSQEYSSKKMSLSINNPLQLLILGYAKDFGICSGITKSGNKCTVPVNRSHGDYCIYHAVKASKKFKRRPMLQGEGQGVTVKKSKFDMTPKNPLAHVQKSAASVDTGFAKSRLPTMSEAMKGFSMSPCEAGARNLKVFKQRLTSQDVTSSSNLQSSSAKSVTKISSARARLLEMQKSFSTQKMSSLPAKLTPSEAATQRAISLVKSGKISLEPSYEAKSNNYLAKENDVMTAWIDKLDSLDVHLDDIFRKSQDVPLDKGALIDSAYQTNVIDPMFDRLAPKDANELKLSSIDHVKTRAFVCAPCKSVTQAFPKICKDKGHKIKSVQATLRYFKCVGCSWRTSSFHIYPLAKCDKCRGNQFKRCAVSGTSCEDVPKHKDEILVLRGEEIKFLGQL